MVRVSEGCSFFGGSWLLEQLEFRLAGRLRHQMTGFVADRDVRVWCQLVLTGISIKEAKVKGRAERASVRPLSFSEHWLLHFFLYFSNHPRR